MMVTMIIMINMVLIIIGSVRCAGVNEDGDEDEEFYSPEVWYFVFVHVFVLT